jgi:hypothetical protein
MILAYIAIVIDIFVVVAFLGPCARHVIEKVSLANERFPICYNVGVFLVIFLIIFLVVSFAFVIPFAVDKFRTADERLSVLSGVRLIVLVVLELSFTHERRSILDTRCFFLFLVFDFIISRLQFGCRLGFAFRGFWGWRRNWIHLLPRLNWSLRCKHQFTNTR